MDNINNLDVPFVMAEINGGDINITPVDVVNRLIKNNEDLILAAMLDYHYQTNSDKVCEPIDKAVKELYQEMIDNNI